MPYTQEAIPFASGSHESWHAAVKATATRGVKTRAYLQLLATRGPLTDHDARAALGLPLSSINSIRGNLMHAGLVEKGMTTRVSPYGVQCRVWLITRAGRAALTELELS